MYHGGYYTNNCTYDKYDVYIIRISRSDGLRGRRAGLEPEITPYSGSAGQIHRVMQQPDNMDVTIRRNTVNNKMACGTAPSCDVECAYSGPDFFACATCRVLRVIKQIVERAFDQPAVLPTLPWPPTLGALL